MLTVIAYYIFTSALELSNKKIKGSQNTMKKSSIIKDIQGKIYKKTILLPGPLAQTGLPLLEEDHHVGQRQRRHLRPGQRREQRPPRAGGLCRTDG